MPAATILLLEQARASRAQAERARRLARDVTHAPDVGEKLARYAEELEQRALELEERAVDLAKTIAKTRELSAELRGLIEEARAHIRKVRAKRRPLHDQDHMDVIAIAQDLIRRFGADAADIGEDRAEAYRQARENEGAGFWQRVADAARAILSGHARTPPRRPLGPKGQ